jgi:photosystem II stability/assembly factor-like uncharacterized protein
MNQSVIIVLLMTLLGAAPSAASAEITVWTSLGPDAGSIRALVIDPQNPMTLYAGTDAGLFKSTDQGRTWLKSGLPGTYAGPLAIDPQDSAVVYAGAALCPEGCGWGLFKSTDGGTNWSAANSGLPEGLSSLAVDPQNSMTLFAGTNAGLFESTDGGTTWVNSGLPCCEVVPSMTTYVGPVVIDPKNPSIVYAAAILWGPDSRLFKSMDGGQTWNASAFSFRGTGNTWGSQISALAVDPQNPEIIYVAADQLNDEYGLFKSTDGGTSWTNWNDFNIDAFIANSGLNANSIFALTVDPQRPGVVYAGTNNGPYKSTDSGITWGPVSCGLSDRIEVHTVAINPQNPGRVYIGTHSGSVFEIAFESPVLTLDSTKYCIGTSWRLKVINSAPQTSVRLRGTSNGQSWEISDWRETDANGSFNVVGTVAGGTAGSHTLTVEIGGAFSDPISFLVSDCNP